MSGIVVVRFLRNVCFSCHAYTTDLNHSFGRKNIFCVVFHGSGPMSLSPVSLNLLVSVVSDNPLEHISDTENYSFQTEQNTRH